MRSAERGIKGGNTTGRECVPCKPVDLSVAREVPKDYDHEWVPDLKFGEGTGSATPLAWSMAQFIRLAVNLKAGRNLDTPQIVYDRYVAEKR